MTMMMTCRQADQTAMALCKFIALAKPYGVSMVGVTVTRVMSRLAMLQTKGDTQMEHSITIASTMGMAEASCERTSKWLLLQPR